MQTTNCPVCGHKLHAFPDATHCPDCGENLRDQTDSPTGIHYDVHYHFQRANELAARGELAAALAAARRGLADHDAPDLHLLAAILCQQMGRVDEISVHVAAIPVDDSLRTEAEWLLRSQQRQAAVPSGKVTDDEADDSFSLDEIIGRRSEPEPKSIRKPRRWPAVVALLALTALLIVWFANGARWSQFGFSGETSGDAADTVQTVRGAVSADPVDPVQVDGEDEEGAAGLVLLPTSTPPPTPLPTPIPAPTIRPDLVLAPTAPSELAGSGDASSPVFDLQAYLIEGDYEELAGLDVTALLEGAELTLAGFVPYAVQRTQLIEIAETISGVGSVNATELYFRPPVTYTVQSGDTLWSITFRVYGDVERMEDVYNANRDVMTSPGALVVGMELGLPPTE